MDLRPGRRALRHEVGVDEQGYVLSVDGHAVQVTGVGEGLDGRRSELAGAIAQVNGGDQTAGGQFAKPVVGANDDVRTFAGRAGGGDQAADVAEANLLQQQLNVVLVLEGRLDLAQGCLLYTSRCV